VSDRLVAPFSSLAAAVKNTSGSAVVIVSAHLRMRPARPGNDLHALYSPETVEKHSAFIVLQNRGGGEHHFGSEVSSHTPQTGQLWLLTWLVIRALEATC